MIIKKKRITKTSPNKKEIIEKEETVSKSPMFRKKEIRENIKKEAKYLGSEFLENAKALVSPDFRNFSIVAGLVASKTLESAAIKGTDPNAKTPIGSAVNTTKKVITAPVKVMKAVKSKQQSS